MQYNSDYSKTKKREPSCCILGRHPEDSFIKLNNNPDPTKYNPIDSFYSRRKRSAQFGFGSAKRFDYNEGNIRYHSQANQIKWLDQELTQALLKTNQNMGQSDMQLGRPMLWSRSRKVYRQVQNIYYGDNNVAFVFKMVIN